VKLSWPSTISAIVSPCIANEGVARPAETISSHIAAASFEKPDIFKPIPLQFCPFPPFDAESTQSLDTIPIPIATSHPALLRSEKSNRKLDSANVGQLAIYPLTVSQLLLKGELYALVHAFEEAESRATHESTIRFILSSERGKKRLGSCQLAVGNGCGAHVGDA
jgi:hypothetical protein